MFALAVRDKIRSGFDTAVCVSVGGRHFREQHIDRQAIGAQQVVSVERDVHRAAGLDRFVQPSGAVDLTIFDREVGEIDQNLRLLPPPAAVDFGERRIVVNDLPMRAQIDTPIQEQLIVELYSK